MVKQRVSSRAANCVNHKTVPLKLEFSKLIGEDDSFCLGLNSPANLYFVHAQLDLAKDWLITRMLTEI